jgi:hypothetical protein
LFVNVSPPAGARIEPTHVPLNALAVPTLLIAQAPPFVQLVSPASKSALSASTVKSVMVIFAAVTACAASCVVPIAPAAILPATMLLAMRSAPSTLFWYAAPSQR